MKYRAKAIRTVYWTPGADYLQIIVNSLSGKVRDSDVIVVSEKAVATAKGRLVDERNAKASYLSKFITIFWMRYLWGYILGRLCHLKALTINRLRNYPFDEGAAHKQTVLLQSGFLQALRHGSEGGVDVSNLPFAYACLPLDDPYQEAQKILSHIKSGIGKNVSVMIVDTDKTYSYRNLHLTPRPKAMNGILAVGGVVTYVVCRALKLRPQATPLAVVGAKLHTREALHLAEFAHAIRGSGAGKTAWDVAERFHVGLTNVTWQMLNSIDHYPIVIVRRVSNQRSIVSSSIL